MTLADTLARDDYPFVADTADEAGPEGKTIAAFNWLPGEIALSGHRTWEVCRDEPLTIKLTFEDAAALEAARLRLARGPQGIVDGLDHELQMDLVRAQAREAHDSAMDAVRRFEFLVMVCQKHLADYVTPKRERSIRPRLLHRWANWWHEQIAKNELLTIRCLLEQLDGPLWRQARDAKNAIRPVTTDAR